MKHFFLRSLLVALLLAAATSPQAQAIRVRLSPGPSYDVRITPTALPAGTTSVDIGPTLWCVQGFDLRGLLAHVYGIEPARIDLRLPAASADPARFDISLPLAGDESDQTVQTILAAAVQTRFHLAAALETRSVDVYVLSAPNGPGPGLHPVRASAAHGAPAALAFVGYSAADSDHQPTFDSAGSEAPLAETVTLAGRSCPGISTAGLTAHATSLASLARTLEQELERPIVDETHLAGLYNFELPEYRTHDQLFALLHSQLGLDIKPARRELAILTIHPTSKATSDQTAMLLYPAVLAR